MFKRIKLVLQREYISRVKKRSFIVMTFLTPILVAFFYGIIFYIIYSQQNTQRNQEVCVFDSSGFFANKLKESEHVKFTYKEEAYSASYNFIEQGFDACLVLHLQDTSSKDYTADIFSKESLSLVDQSNLEHNIADVLYENQLNNLNINRKQLEDARVNVTLKAKKWSQGEVKESSAGAATGLGFAASILIYFFIFIYGSQVMRGVMEEKTNRIVEVIISSVKPFELMMGKILGIALVALTQMALWVILSGVAMGFVTSMIGSQMHLNGAAQQLMEQSQQGGGQFKILQLLSSLNLSLMGFSFLFYFIFGYLFYASLFAAVGSAVDSETELQQFTLPISLPLVFSFILTQSLLTSNPNGNLLFWISMIPFSSPVAMMARIPFLESNNYWQIALSMGILVLSFIGTVWLAARIYRTGILMYGKKASWKELWKWLFYKG
ncbi:MAG: ABC transporter permease [Bacteroidetes bacterium]|nr:ABC transporter permease [Bacteroidota bacterium]